MPTEALTIGPVHTIAQTTGYALPARAVYVHSNAALEVSNNAAFSTTQAVAANTPTVVAGAFVRCTGSTAIVTLKAL